ncbi:MULTISPECIES: hypothetical protein [Kitasatospora]|uniref:Uncharacterized protein n=1 Tax=Kitasatospora cathayae TaxID=3004092 RepID=A0ABY7QFN6_9ACTN|nr:hypothetical protein [Kitasatospora sp. HUAS 3-15]WBP91219.1 hypothetical protein O1G21_38640 [Kitasatospora sp. HUAS 3-15]
MIRTRIARAAAVVTLAPAGTALVSSPAFAAAPAAPALGRAATVTPDSLGWGG